jgi:hypothetical protein
VLEVVEDHEEALVPQVTDERLANRLTRSWRRVQCTRDGRKYEPGVRERGEIDEVHAVLELIEQVCGDGQGQPRLPRATRPGERHQPGVSAT